MGGEPFHANLCQGPTVDNFSKDVYISQQQHIWITLRHNPLPQTPSSLTSLSLIPPSSLNPTLQYPLTPTNPSLRALPSTVVPARSVITTNVVVASCDTHPWIDPTDPSLFPHITISSTHARRDGEEEGVYLLAILELLVALVADGVTGDERVGRSDGVGGGGGDGGGGGEGRDEEEEGGGVLHCWWSWCELAWCVVEEIVSMVDGERDVLGAAHRGFICTLGGVLGSDMLTW